MINRLNKRAVTRFRRKMRVRKGVRGTKDKPRLSVFRSNRHLFAQLIDDENGVTLASSGTMTKEFKSENLGKGKAAARRIGVQLAEMAKKKEIRAVVFDRGFYKYHGLLAEVANGARETGLQF